MKHSVSKEDKELLEQDKPWLDAFLQEHYGVAPKKKNAKRVWVAYRLRGGRSPCPHAGFVFTARVSLVRYGQNGYERR